MHSIFHVSRFRSYDASGDLRGLDPPAPVTVDGHTEWEVDCILGHRYVGRYRTLQYRVLWRGFDIGQATWEPA